MIFAGTISLNTKGFTDIINITDKVRSVLEESKFGDTDVQAPYGVCVKMRARGEYEI